MAAGTRREERVTERAPYRAVAREPNERFEIPRDQASYLQLTLKVDKTEAIAK